MSVLWNQDSYVQRVTIGDSPGAVLTQYLALNESALRQAIQRDYPGQSFVLGRKLEPVEQVSIGWTYPTQSQAEEILDAMEHGLWLVEGQDDTELFDNGELFVLCGMAYDFGRAFQHWLENSDGAVELYDPRNEQLVALRTKLGIPA